MDLYPYVNIFRAAGKPASNGSNFQGTIKFDDEIIQLINELREKEGNAFETILIDGNLLLDEPLPANGDVIEVHMRLPGGSGNRFYKSIEDMLNLPQLSKGKMLDEFYIIDEDYYSGDAIKHSKIEKLKSICQFIKRLSELANYHDSKTTDNHLKLVFVQPSEKETVSPVELSTKIDKNLLDYDPPDICTIDDLCNGNIQTDPHLIAKKGVFRITLAEFLNKRSSNVSNFEYLIRNWNDLVVLYHNNIGTYLSGFAFHKARQEVAQAELEIAEHFSNLIGEITGKVLSIPISFVAVIAIIKSEFWYEGLIIVISLLMVALILDRSVGNQQKQLQCIGDAKEIKFDSFGGKRESYPEDLRQALDNMIKRINKNETALKRLLCFFRAGGWIPCFAGFIVFLYTYTNFFQWVISLTAKSG